MTDFDEIYHLYFKDVFRFIKALSRDDGIAEEITQDTFFKALKTLDRFKGNCDIRVWLCQIAKNSYYTYCKKKNKTINIEEIKELPIADTNIETKLVDQEQAFDIHKILHELEEPYKEIFSLRVFSELSFVQIGQLFGKTESWARVTFHRAKRKIIDNLKGADS